MSESSTIAAFATPLGHSALAIIRVSGKAVRSLIASVFKRKDIQSRISYFNAYRGIDGNVLDECVWTYFEAPGSYTGEDLLEISCHGNTFISKRILNDLMSRGCSPAEPGEFTKRAFLNGKMDLTQAEAVSDIISASSERAFEAAKKLLSGELSRKISEWNEQILMLLAETETQIDFSEEEVPEIDGVYFRSKIEALTEDLRKTAESSKYASKVHEGVNVVIFGAPNAGKSSLLNAVLGADRALVSDEAGTTRDFISEKVLIGKNCINIIDTAGIRDNTDSFVEKSGIKRTRDCMDGADFLVFVVDGSAPCPTLSEEFYSGLDKDKVLVVFNKNDLPNGFNQDDFLTGFESVSVSLLKTSGAEIFKAKLSEILESKNIVPDSDTLIVSARHAEAMKNAEEMLNEAAEIIGIVPIEFVSSKLRGAVEELSEILGRFDNEKVLDKVFSGFCIGK